jgi:hypothetical protein
MIRGLLEKELRQHGFTLVFLGVLLLGGLVLISGHGPLRRLGGGGFAALQLLHYTFIPLACLVLGQVLIATEFRQKTQLFLEGLPLPRWRMLAVKFLLGLGAIVAAVGLALALAWWRARHSEAMTPRFALLLAVKSLGWVWFFYTLCFAHAFLGRYRAIFAVAVLFGLLYAVQSGIELSKFGPFALVDTRFAYERFVFPTEALIVTAALGGGLVLLGFSLGLMRDATVATLLAEKMSGREKIFMVLLAFAATMAGTYVSERQKSVAPVHMPGAIESQRGVVRVLASAAVDAPSRAEIAALDAITKRTAQELGALAEYLGCKSFPAVFIVHRRDLGAEFINGDLKPTQGVLVRTNLLTEGFDELALQKWLVRETLLAHSGTLAGRERNAWVLDGFSWWWPQSQHGKAEGPDPAAMAEAKTLMPADFSARNLRAWFTLRGKLGEEKARQLAGSGLAVLAQRQGAESNRRFLAAMLSRAKPADFRGWWRDVLRSTPSRLRAATGWTETDLVREWRAALAGEKGSPP